MMVQVKLSIIPSTAHIPCMLKVWIFFHNLRFQSLNSWGKCVRACSARMLLARHAPTIGAGRKIRDCNSCSEEINHVLMAISMLGKVQLNGRN